MLLNDKQKSTLKSALLEMHEQLTKTEEERTSKKVPRMVSVNYPCMITTQVIWAQNCLNAKKTLP